jgi:hypothetical protein
LKKSSWKLELDEKSDLTRVGTGKDAGIYRVISFCELETKVD